MTIYMWPVSEAHVSVLTEVLVLFFLFMPRYCCCAKTSLSLIVCESYLNICILSYFWEYNLTLGLRAFTGSDM